MENNGLQFPTKIVLSFKWTLKPSNCQPLATKTQSHTSHIELQEFQLTMLTMLTAPELLRPFASLCTQPGYRSGPVTPPHWSGGHRSHSGSWTLHLISVTTKLAQGVLCAVCRCQNKSHNKRIRLVQLRKLYSEDCEEQKTHWILSLEYPEMFRPRNSAWQAGAPFFGAENGKNERIRFGNLMLFEISWEIKNPTKFTSFSICAPFSDGENPGSKSFFELPMVAKWNRISRQLSRETETATAAITDVVPTCSDDFGVERSFCWQQHVGFKASQSFRPLHLSWLPHLREAEPLKSERKFKQIPIHHQVICLCSVETYSLFVYIWKRHCKDN